MKYEGIMGGLRSGINRVRVIYVDNQVLNTTLRNGCI